MRTLNRAAAEAVRRRSSVHACTDITGFGLLGHASEMATASGVTLDIEAGAVPVFDGVLALVAAEPVGRDGTATAAHFGGAGRAGVRSVPTALADLLFDPQTSGGLLAGGRSPDWQPRRTLALAAAGVPPHAVGGRHGRTSDSALTVR